MANKQTIQKNSSLSRRSLIKWSAALTAFPTVIPSSVIGAQSPSQSFRLGIIGLGNIARGYHIPAFGRNKDVNLVAICDVDRRKYDGAINRAKPFFKHQPTTYLDYLEMFEKEDLDVVSVATPDHWHTLCSIDALKKGIDVYCEKPLSRYQREGRILTDVARRYGRVLQTGSQQRSQSTFQRAVNLARNGYAGQIKRVWVGVGNRMPRVCHLGGQPVPPELDYERWVGPADFMPYHERRVNGDYNHEKGWRGWLDYSISMFGDWGAHHFDIAQWGIGRDGSGPVEIIPPSKSPHGATTMIYDDGVELIQKPHDTSRMQVTFEGTEGWVAASRDDFLTSDGLKGIQLKPSDINVSRGVDHQRDFLDCVKTRSRPIADVEIGHTSATVCHLAFIANLLDRPLKWKPSEERFIGDDAANGLLFKSYREPYSL